MAQPLQSGRGSTLVLKTSLPKTSSRCSCIPRLSGQALKADKLIRYQTLDKSGQVDRLVAGRDLAAVQTLSEAEVRSAIDNLNTSTAAIALQTETLRQQQEALARLVKANAKNHDARSDLEFKRTQRRDADRRRVASVVSKRRTTPDVQC
jgi:hypothetical protein